MPNLNLTPAALAGLQNFDDFHFKGAEIAELAQRGGRFTLDDQGALTVIVPPARRDHGFVRFIKGLFSSGYRAEQRKLDRMEALERNAVFSTALFKAAGEYGIPSPYSRLDEHREWETNLKSLLSLHEGDLCTPDLVRSAIDRALAIRDENRLNGAISDVFHSGAGTCLTPQGVKGFSSLFGPALEEHGISLSRLVRNLGNQIAVMSDVSVDGEDLLSGQDQERLRELQSAAQPLSELEKQEEAALEGRMFRRVVDLVAERANHFFQRGASEVAVVERFTAVLKALDHGAMPPGDAFRLAGDAADFAEQGPAPELRLARDPRPTALTPEEAKRELRLLECRNTALAAMEGDSVKAAKLLEFCTQHRISQPFVLEVALHMEKKVADALSFTPERIKSNPRGFLGLMNEISLDMSRLADDPEAGADDMAKVYSTALFMADLKGRPVENALSLQDTAALIATGASLQQILPNSPTRQFLFLLFGYHAEIQLNSSAPQQNFRGPIDPELAKAMARIDTEGERLSLAGVETFSPQTRELLLQHGAEKLTDMQRRVLNRLGVKALLAEPVLSENPLDEAQHNRDLDIVRATFAARIADVLDPDAARRRIAGELVRELGDPKPDLKNILRQCAAMDAANTAYVFGLQERGKQLGADDTVLVGKLFTQALYDSGADREDVSRAIRSLERNPDLQGLLRLTGTDVLMNVVQSEGELLNTNDSLLETNDLRDIFAALDTGLSEFINGAGEFLGLPGERFILAPPAGSGEAAEEVSMTRAEYALYTGRNLSPDRVTENAKQALLAYLRDSHITCNDINALMA